MTIIILGLVTIILLVSFVWWPAWKLRSVEAADPSEWRVIAGDIRKLTRDTVEAPGYSETAKQALLHVLTTEPGYGHLSHAPLALDVIQAKPDYKARTLRALGGQSIVIGLLGTAATFALLFGQHSLFTPKPVPPSSTSDGAAAAFDTTGQPQPDLKIDATLMPLVVQHLFRIYVVNGIAIFSAAALLNASWRSRQRGEEAALLASEAFASLEDSSDQALAPELARALSLTAEEFRGFSEHLLNHQFARIEQLLGSVGSLGNAIKDLVREVVSQNQQDARLLQAQLRDSSTAIERMSERLDKGFTLLAQPFMQGIPAMQTITESADALKQAADVVLQANIARTVTQLKIAVSGLDRTTGELPGRVSAAVSDAAESIRVSTRDAVVDGVREALAPVAQNAGEVLEATKAAVAAASTDFAERVRALAEQRQLADEALRAHLDRAVVAPLVQHFATASEVTEQLQREIVRATGALERSTAGMQESTEAGVSAAIERAFAPVAGELVDSMKRSTEAVDAAAAQLRSTGAFTAEQRVSANRELQGQLEGRVVAPLVQHLATSSVALAEVQRQILALATGLEASLETVRATVAETPRELDVRLASTLASGAGAFRDEASDVLARHRADMLATIDNRLRTATDALLKVSEALTAVSVASQQREVVATPPPLPVTNQPMWRNADRYPPSGPLGLSDR